jgi:uncharacterized repeat protein (TIGR01451 family)
MNLRALATVVLTLSGLLRLTAEAAENPWSDLGQLPQNRDAAERWLQPERFRALGLDAKLLLDLLAPAKREAQQPVAQSPTELLLPLPDGAFARFRIVEAPIMEPELAAKFPEVKTYLGQGVDDPTATARLDWTPAGFHAQILSADGAVYVDPAFRHDPTVYVCYARRDLQRATGDFVCLLPGDFNATQPLGAGYSLARSSDGNLRTYRLACAATGEYTTYHGGTVAAGQAAIVTAINRVNGVYERELAIRLVLVANNNLIVYTSASTDPYSNTDGVAMLTQNQANLTTVIGSANYDIGHVFSTGGGGIATLGCACVASWKARGVTGNAAPTGDAFWIDYVAHELGHQFGANHCFNSVSGECGGGARNAATAYEPGSGSTIMAYAGICSPDNLQAHSDAYFHAVSFDEIVTFATGGSGITCAAVTATGNTAPAVSAGAAYTIPRSTPFTLIATGSDANGDALTYCWEEMDLGVATTLAAADNGSSPIFRSFNPTNSPARTFPQWSDILNNRTSAGEKLPVTSRTMTFRVTARDNRAGGGGVNTADTTVTSVSNAGPFVLTSPNMAAAQSNQVTVTWNVAGTTNAPISATGVNIRLSTNGGNSFPFLLASNTPNDGSEVVLLPSLATSAARLKIEGTDNIFFDVSNTNFTIVRGNLIVAVGLDSATLVAENCGSGNGRVDPGETVTVNFALRNTGTLGTTNLVVTLLETNGLLLASGPQAYGALAGGGAAVSRPFTFTGTGACNGTLTAQLQLQDGAMDLGLLSVPFPLGTSAVATVTFSNAGALTIPGTGTLGNGSPYPSAITVADVAGTVTKVTVTLPNLSHTNPDDMDALLVGPTGQTLLLLSDTGGNHDVVGVTLTFSDSAAAALGDNTAITSGAWKPSSYGTGDTFPAPAPSGTFGTNFQAFNGLNPTGVWSLYIVDDKLTDSGSLPQGWSLSLTTSNPVCCASSADLALGGSVVPAAANLGDALTLTLGVTNLGPAAALGVTVADTLPAGLSVLSVNSSQGSHTTVGNLVTASLGALAPGGTATVSILARGEVAGYWTNQATLATTSADPSLANNTLSLPVFVNTAPTLSAIADVVTAQNSPAGPIAFLIGDDYTPADSLNLTGGSSNTNLVPDANLLFGGSGTQRSLTLQPAPGLTGSATITVVVSDGLASASTNFLFTVIPRPEVQPLVVAGGEVTITWSTAAGQVYRLQFKDDLGLPAWTDLGPPRTATGTTLSAMDPAPAANQRFYRVLVVE